MRIRYETTEGTIEVEDDHGANALRKFEEMLYLLMPHRRRSSLVAKSTALPDEITDQRQAPS